jgi:hypothetical protein
MEKILNSLKEEISKISFNFQRIREDNDNAHDDYVKVEFNSVKEDNDFLNIIEDFYLVESINKLDLRECDKDIHQHIANIKKISTSHGNLLRLAFFYFSEFEKCIDESNNINLENYYLDIPYLDIPYFNSIDTMFEYLIEKSTDNDYVLERLYTLSILYAIITNYDFYHILLHIRRIKRDNWRQYITKESIEQVSKLFGHIKEWVNDAIKNHEEHLLGFITDQEFNHVGKYDGINYFGKKFQKALKENQINSHSKFIKDKLNCYASVDYEGKKYFSINGLDNDKEDHSSNKCKTITILEDLLKKETKCPTVEYVRIPNGTRYYFNKQENCCISYEEFKNREPDKKYNRMFTCCERKLIAKIREETGKEKFEVVLNITKQPCELCEREIGLVKAKFQNPNIEINKDEKEFEVKIEDMDAYARDIYDNR